MGKKRVLILTDSLGCPREDVDVEDTWVDQLLRDNTLDVWFYTYCERGQYAKRIDVNRIKLLNPDIIICQIGIVDATRRAIHRLSLAIISRIPILSKVCNILIRKNHYFLTKIRKIHCTNIRDYTRILESIFSCSNCGNIFICIAPPGQYMKEQVFNIDNDVNQYNKVITDLNFSNTILLNPYKNQKDYMLQDGHHLNKKGHELIFLSVKDALAKMVN